MSEAGHQPHRESDPNLPVILTAAREHSSVLTGPPLVKLIDPRPGEHVTQSMPDALTSLLDDLVGDERNVLLTLGRDRQGALR